MYMNYKLVPAVPDKILNQIFMWGKTLQILSCHKCSIPIYLPKYIL